MYTVHPTFTSPDDPNETIWRYMEFSKFVSLLSTSRIFFAPASSMVDKFEGSFSRANLEARKAWYSELPINAAHQIETVRRDLTKHVYLSCWHMSRHESAGMWGLYQAEGRGVAIKSTFNRLKDSLDTTQEVYIGKVNYIDYIRDVMPENNMLYPFVHKRRSFQHERELRAVIADIGAITGRTNYELENNIAVDLDELILAVHVAPDSPDWFLSAVKSVALKYGLKAPIRRSAMDKDPVY